MDKIKNNVTKEHKIVLVGVLVIIAGVMVISGGKNHYSLADFGVSPLIGKNCSETPGTQNSPVAISFNSPYVPSVREKIKELITKHGGKITNDSLESYWSEGGYTASDDTSYMTAIFETSREEFLVELSVLIEESGGVNEGYNYSSGEDYGAYSSYASCASMMHDVAADFLELKILTKALKEENKTKNISLLSQSIAESKMSLQESVDIANNFFSASDKPAVDISIFTLQKEEDMSIKLRPMY
ncbi:MAG: hypothetical protein M3M85_00405 [bacterium]|nr:hypothetical protein [bacterium]